MLIGAGTLRQRAESTCWSHLAESCDGAQPGIPAFHARSATYEGNLKTLDDETWEAALYGSFVSTAAITGAVVAAIIAVLIVNGVIISDRKRKSNRNVHLVTPACTGALASGGSPYLPSPGVASTHLQQLLRRAHCHFLYPRT